PWSDWVAETPIGPAPTLDAVNYADAGTALTFTAPTLSPGTTITSYEYEISTDGGSTIVFGPYDTTIWANSYGNTGATSSPYTEPEGQSYCQVGTTCAYRIRAVVGGGTFRSPWSVWVNVGLTAGLASSSASGAAPFTPTFTLTVGDPSGET